MGVLVFRIGKDRAPIVNPGTSATIVNIGPGAVWIGGGGVTVNADFRLLLGTSYTVQAPSDDFVYAISHGVFPLPYLQASQYEV